jgi:hypothetical protein
MTLNKRFFETRLSRDEIALIEFYRQLSPEEQLALFEAAENGANVILRMRELAGRLVEHDRFENEARPI